MKESIIKTDNSVILYDADLSGHDADLQAGDQWFDPQWWQKRGNLIGSPEGGRGQACFIDRGGEQWVLRHYRRGGMVARLIHDHYLYLGMARSRAFSEWRVTAKLFALGLPVPRPVAARVCRRGLIYSCDLITRRIDTARTLSVALTQSAMAEVHWARLGQVIALFHRAGLFHADLNAHNIVVSFEDEALRFWLIDFDKARFRKPGSWQQANLDRLLRSLDKLQRLYGLRYTNADWQTLVRSYHACYLSGDIQP